MSKVLFRQTIGNGYGCSCCAQQWSSAEWINEKDMKSFDKILNMIFNSKDPDYWYKDHDSTILSNIYEKDSKVLYGFSIDYFKCRQDIYIHVGNKKFKAQQIDDKTCEIIEQGNTRNELLEIYKKYIS